MPLNGTNFARMTRHGLQAIRSYWKKTRDQFEIRRQALKLMFWDERHLHPPGMLIDMTYESIKALSGLGIYELRLDDDIGGHRNIRVIFFDPPTNWQPIEDFQNPLRNVWILEVMPKRRQEWTANDISRFRTARRMIALRFCGQN